MLHKPVQLSSFRIDCSIRLSTIVARTKTKWPQNNTFHCTTCIRGFSGNGCPCSLMGSRVVYEPRSHKLVYSIVILLWNFLQSIFQRKTRKIFGVYNWDSRWKHYRMWLTFGIVWPRFSDHQRVTNKTVQNFILRMTRFTLMLCFKVHS